MFSKPTVKSCFFASKMMFQACRFHYLLLFSLSISKIDNDFYLDAKILILKIKRVGPSQYPHTHTSRPWETFIWKASKAWNTIYKYVLNSKKGLATPVNSIKHRSKAIILECQALHNPQVWKPDNFSLVPKATKFSYTMTSHTSPDMPHDEICIT